MKIDIAQKISIILGVLMASLSLFYYLVIFLPQAEKGRMAMQKQEQQDAKEQQIKNLEQHIKEYIARRGMECYDIYEKEDKKSNNVIGWSYQRERDVCSISYQTDLWKKDFNCNDLLKNDNAKEPHSKVVLEIQMERYIDCSTHSMSKHF